MRRLNRLVMDGSRRHSGTKAPSVVAASVTNPLNTTYHQSELPTNIGTGPQVLPPGAGHGSADRPTPAKYGGVARQPVVVLDRSHGIGGLREETFVMNDGQILGFTKSDKEKGKVTDQPLPCDNRKESAEATKNMSMGSAPFAIKKPSSTPVAANTKPTAIKRPLFSPPTVQPTKSSVPGAAAAYLGRPSPKINIEPPTVTKEPPVTAPVQSHSHSHSHSHGAGSSCSHGEYDKAQDRREAEDFYKTIPNLPDKEEVWARIQKRGREEDLVDTNKPTGVDPTEVDFMKMEEEIKENDLFHYRVGELAFVDENLRRDFYAMHLLSMSLNKARWTMMEVHAEKGQKTTGAGMKLMYWKDSTSQIIEQRNMPSGQFVDSHPVLRQFSHATHRHKLTKTFLRGMVDAKLKVVHQPGNMKQLFEIFDKSYGYFYNSLLEMMGIKDDAAEHVMLHIGRAVGLTQHSVMFWKKYARLGFTMIPADVCADNHINIGLLKNLHLAEKDRYVRRALYDVMSVVKTEMLHAQDIISTCPVEAWPLIMDSFYPNYYLGFLQKHNFNVSAMWADENIENAGFSWYKYKKVAQWERNRDIGLLIAEKAPIPYLGFSLLQKESKYKRSSDMTGPSGTQPTNMGKEEAESSRSRM